MKAEREREKGYAKATKGDKKKTHKRQKGDRKETHKRQKGDTFLPELRDSKVSKTRNRCPSLCPHCNSNARLL